MKLVSNEEMSRIDAESQSEFGIPGTVLMESAGFSAWSSFAETLSGKSQQIVFVAGTGNNGGDALVMARYCHVGAKHEPVVVLLKEGATGDAALQLSIVRALGVPVLNWESEPDAVGRAIQGCNVIVDGITGTGISGALRSPAQELVSKINGEGVPVVAIDCPSGIGDSFTTGMPTIIAVRTLTIGLPKRCLYLPAARANCGVIQIIPASFPVSLTDDPRIPAELVVPESLSAMLPRLPVNAYKKSRGTVAIYAGSVGYTGAAALAGEAALRSRAGLATLLVDGEIYPIVAAKLTSVIVRPFDGSGRAGNVADADAVVVGPGWGTESGRERMLGDLLDGYDAGVLDADAITLLSGLPDSPYLDEKWVLTPHPGELARLIGSTPSEVLDDPIGSLKSGVERTRAIVVLKTHTTWAAHPDGRIAVIDGTNPVLGTAGSGDVLAGVIGGLIPSLGSWQAVLAGTLIHSLAGRQLAERSGFFLAQELLPEISRIAAASQQESSTRGA